MDQNFVDLIANIIDQDDPDFINLSEKKLSTTEKKKAPKALPQKDAYPIPDKNHAKNALARAKQFASPSDQKTIAQNVKKKFPGINVEMKPGEPTVKLGPTSKNEFIDRLDTVLKE